MSGERNEAGGVPVWGSDLPRISTGSAPADRILGGGFPVNSINMIMGEPGTGKTLFAQQLVFHNAGGDRPILYLTTLSEPLPKVVKYLQGFDFFDEAKLGTSVIYDEVGNELAAEGIGALVPRVRDRIKALSPKIIVIDSFKALHDIAPSIAEMRHVVHDLAGLLTAYETTTFLVGEYSEEQMAILPEFVVADGIVELLRHESGMRDDRYFRVRKLRGSGYREGRHALRLTAGGVEIYRRLITPTNPPDYTVRRERVSTGVAGLDAMVGGGVGRKLLRCHVRGRANRNTGSRAHTCGNRGTQCLGNTEIGYERVHPLSEDVVGFDVTVHDTQRMCVRERIDYVVQDADYIASREPF